jgi:hypothetical protein
MLVNRQNGRGNSNQKCKFLGKDVRADLDFLGKNGGGEFDMCVVTLDIGLKTGLGVLGKCFKVRKITKSE